MRASSRDLLAGALGLAFNYCGLSALRQAYARLTTDSNGLDLPQALLDQGSLTEPRAEKLRRGAVLAERLRTEAVYGMVVIRNRVVSGQMLNACMEETRKSGYQKGLSEVLMERQVVSPALDEAILARQEEILPDLLAKETSLAGTIDLEHDPEETVDLKLAALLGEVASQVSFLTHADLDTALNAQTRVEQGLPVEEPAPPPRPVSLKQPAGSGIHVQVPVQPGGAEADDPIKGYELLDKLGSGAMGAVLKARKRDTGEIVALKILKPELAKDSEYVDRFMREAKAVQRLNHPNIIRAVQIGRAGDYYFFAMEFIHGQTISDMLKGQGPVPERFALTVTRCIASALSHAWTHQIIHRDIKPDNIMVTQEGAVKLTDLGLARTAKQDSTLTITGVVMGSPAYISPEQATGEKNLDSRSDIYSLGATLFHMLTGQVPYDGESPLHVMLKHMNDPLPDVRKVRPDVSEATRLVIMKMMAKRPEGRFQSAQQAEAAVRSIEEALAQGRQPPIPAGLSPQKRPAASGSQQVKAAASGSSGIRRTAASGPSSGAVAASASASGARKKAGKKKVKKVDAKKAAEKTKKKEVGQRLKRMAKQRRKRF